MPLKEWCVNIVCAQFFTIENYPKLLHEIPTANAPLLTKKLSDFIVQNSKAIISQKFFNEEFIAQHPGMVLDLLRNQAKMSLTASYLVEGAGTEAVNGLYRIKDIFKDCPMYEFHGSDGQTYTLFRYKMPNSGKSHFYISIIPDGKSPGKSSDIDYYEIDVSTTAMTPPLVGWVVAYENPKALEPAPRLRINQE